MRNYGAKSSIKLSDIANILINDFGITFGDTIIVHTSYRNILKCDYEPEDLIYLLKTIVGSEGNIIMPSFRRTEDFKAGKPFNVKKTIGYSGLINEILRRDSDSLRSAHPWKSCVVWGKDAKYLVEDHWRSVRAFDEKSPYSKAMKLNGKFVGIGVNYDHCSFLHTVEDNNPELIKGIDNVLYSQSMIMPSGEIVESKYSLVAAVYATRNFNKFMKYPMFQEKKHQNIIFAYGDLRYIYETLLSNIKDENNIYLQSQKYKNWGE